jgi:hypothetical protein
LPTYATLILNPSAAGCIARLAAYRFKYGAKKKPAPFCRGQTAVEVEEAQPAKDEEDQDDIQSNMTLFTEGAGMITKSYTS